MNKRKTLIMGITFIVLVVLGMIGLTYAFFTASVGGNREASSTIVETADLKLVFTDTQILEMNEALPGQSVTKTFTVENRGNVEIEYTIDLVDVLNEFQSGDLVYTLTSTNEGVSANRKVLPMGDETLETATIAPGVTQTYTIEILFRETGSNQNSSQGARFSGKLQINSRGVYSLELVKVAGTVVDENNNPIANATVELHSEVKSAETDANGRFSISGVIPGIHNLVIKDTNREEILTKKVNIDEPVTNAKIKIINEEENEIENIYVVEELTEKMQLETALSDANIDYSYTSNGCNTSSTCEAGTIDNQNQVTNGLYYTEDGTEGNERVYFYRGAVENNYLVFGGYCWRIVRTVEDGSVRLRYGGLATPNGNTYTCPQTAVAVYTNTAGYKYAFDGFINSDANYKTSDIRTTVENWYRDNIWKNETNSKVTNLIADTPYCNDISERVDGPRRYFGAYDRLYTNKSPQYKCEDSTYAYTVAKGDITYPIALLTADEVAYAGGTTTTVNSSYYLYTGEDFWTMSPYFLAGPPILNVFNVNSDGNLYFNNVDTANAVLPAVSLKPEATVKRGTGTYNDPYVINTD